jgi:hypothetical protein
LATATKSGAPGGAGAGTAPRQASLVLLALIAVAAVANLNLTVANVALPGIGRAFDTGQTTLDLIAIGYWRGATPSTPPRSPRRRRARSWPVDQWAYAAAIIGVVLGAALVFALFPRKAAETELLARYQAEDRR